jgi:hypothetical protein
MAMIPSSAVFPTCQAYGGSEPTCPDCQRELQSTLEDWLLLGLRLGHVLPNLSKE